jgi:hypothetical protein
MNNCGFAQIFLQMSEINTFINPLGLLNFVKKVPKENDSFILALQKSLFCRSKQALLSCKTYAFRVQNNGYCKALIT